MDEIIYVRESINSSNYDTPSERSANYYNQTFKNVTKNKKLCLKFVTNRKIIVALVAALIIALIVIAVVITLVKLLNGKFQIK